MAVRVLVAGAGPTGLTAAVELARRGVDVTVIEKRAGPSELSRAVGILPGSMEIFARSGTADGIRAEAVAFSALMIHRGATRVATLPINFDDRSRLLGLAQDRTEQHLADALARYGRTIAFAAPLERFEQDADGVTAHYGGRTGRFDYLVGADGVHSTVRNHLGLAYDGFELPDDWSIADVVSPDWPDPTAFKGYLLPRGRVAVVAPLEAHRFRVIASTADALATLPVPMAVSETRRTGAFRIQVRQVERYRVGRVFLAGDAAHSHSPAGGRGMNLGIADAADLAARLTGGGLDSYEAARRAAGRHVIAFSERARRLAQARGGGRRALLFALLGVIDRVPPLARTAAHRFING